ncbi:MAG TPA: HEAT repeat domain-containing protein [Gemmatimonadaceae bacterium]|nr:HEAT repeat domain-containing protein [Gemmatimonadaceae bacterium]
MTRFESSLVRALAILAAAAPLVPAGAQSLAQRVDAVRDGAIQFSYPVRDGVCGNGRSYISTSPGSFTGNVQVVGGAPTERCEPGPARVIISRAGGVTTSIDAVVGPAAAAPSGVTDLGTVTGAQAHEYLLTQAARLDGKPGRDAILPAMIAEGAGASAPLVALARDRSRPLETRRSAITWIGRMSEAPGRPSGPAAGTLAEMARARDDAAAVRTQAISTLARLGQGEGVPTLIEMTRTSDDSWLAEQAATQLSRSGDPRARQWLRAVVQANETPDGIRQIAIRGLGGSYATAEDMNLLRQSYGRLESTAARERVITTVSTLGGRDNTQWLLGIARTPAEPVSLRRRALTAAEKGGATSAELLGVYQSAGERTMKLALIDLYARHDDRAMTDKLIEIAKGDEDNQVRRRAITRLSSSKDPRAITALQEIIQR